MDEEVAKLFDQYRDGEELNIKPMHYQVIDGIFNN